MKMGFQCVSRRLLGALALSSSFSLLSGASRVRPRPAAVPYDVGSTVYQIMVDRFYDGDTSNNGPTSDTAGVKATNALNQDVDDEDSDYMSFRLMNGGDWQGVAQKMDYIAGMGYKAIWISPIVSPQLWAPESKDGTTYPTAYHGYNSYNPNALNQYFGSKEDLIDLVDTAHTAGISVIVDTVPNHLGNFLPSKSDVYTQARFDPAYTTMYQPAAPWNNCSWYYHNGDTDSFNDTEYSYLISHDLAGLDTLNFDVAEAKVAMIYSIVTNLREIRADAMRIDAAMYILPENMYEIEQATGLKSFGEVDSSQVDLLSRYMVHNTSSKAAWGLLDYPLYYGILHNFALGYAFTNSSNTTIPSVLQYDDSYGGYANHLQTFLDNHDVNRFLTYADNDVSKLQQGLAFIYTARGQPIVFQGTEQEQGNAGGKTEWPIASIFNRWAMFEHDEDEKTISSLFDTGTSTYKWIKKLNGFRDKYASLRTGTQREMWVEDYVYSFSRRIDDGDNEGDETIMIFSTNSETKDLTIPLVEESTLNVGALLFNAYDWTDFMFVEPGGDTGKQITTCIEGQSNKIFRRFTI